MCCALLFVSVFHSTIICLVYVVDKTRNPKRCVLLKLSRQTANLNMSPIVVPNYFQHFLQYFFSEQVMRIDPFV